MSEIAKRLHDLLDRSEARYEVLHHPADFRARTTAADTHTPPREFAKAVFLSEAKLARSLDAKEVRLASEFEMADLCPDCEVGAAPPFGNLYGLPVYVSPIIARDEKITFNAGTHEDAVRMSYADYERLVQPRVVSMTRHEQE